MRIKGKQLADTLRDEGAPFNRVYASQLTGGLVFKAKNASAQAMTVGQAVYIAGVSGDVPEVLLADADGVGTTPAAGLIATGGNASAEVWVITLGELKNVNTSTFSEGDTLYVGATAGALVASPPTGSSAKLQNIGRVVRADSAGVIFVGGAGRSAATPNLDQGKFFIGNASNQSSASVYTLPIADGNAGDVLTTDGAGAVTFSAPSGGATAPTVIDNSAVVGLTANTNYVVDPATSGTLTARVPNSGSTDGDTIEITNLSSQAVIIELYDTSGQAKLYYADGTQAPTVATYRDQITVESQGTIRLYQAGAGDPVEWYLYHSPAFEVEAATSSLSSADTLAYSSVKKAFLSAGEIHGDYVLSSNIANTVRPFHRYVTTYAETTARTISLPDRYNNESIIQDLDGKRIYFENRGASTLTVNLSNSYLNISGVAYRAYLWSFENVNISSISLKPGESVQVEVTVQDVSGTDKRVYYRLGQHTPTFDTTEDTSGANATISHGREKHLTYIVNTANNVTVTLPTLSDCKPDYQITIKNAGAGTVTLSRGSTDTFDGATSTTLAQYDTITLSKRSNSTWSIVNPITPSTSDDLTGNITPTNYTATSSDTLSTHLSAIDSALGGAGGGGTSYTYQAITSASSPVTAQAWYHYSVDASGGAITINLPTLSAVTDGDEIRVKVRDASNNTTIDAGSDTIDGASTFVMNVAYSAITIVAGSTEWEII
jgi:archaellum component FlaG (FlaF/FlaG flagellin family)